MIRSHSGVLPGTALGIIFTIGLHRELTPMPPTLLDYEGARSRLYFVRVMNVLPAGGFEPGRFLAVYRARPAAHREVLSLARGRFPEFRDNAIWATDGSAGLRTLGFPPVVGMFTAVLLDADGRFYDTSFTILNCPVQWTGAPVRFVPRE
jgi:hypothetical protein